MENKTADNIYLIDLSYAKTPADVVFELSSVIETDSASNKRVNLKLGSVDLNQSQLLSIKSLINGINSSLVTLSAVSEQTKQAALSLGMVIDNGVEIPEPTQYVPMTEHIALEEQVLETEKAQIDDSSDNEQQAYTDRNDTEKEEETEATELKADSYIEEKELRHLLKMELVEEVEPGPVGEYRALTHCIIVPTQYRGISLPLTSDEKYMLQWISGAGLRLTMAELVYLEEHKLEPTPEWLGEENRQKLTERIYTQDTIFDNILETQMEAAACRDHAVKMVLSLLRKKRILLL